MAETMVEATTIQKYVAAGAVCMEVKNPKLTSTVRRAMTKISSMDHLPIKAITRNILVFCLSMRGLHGLVEIRRIVRPTILKRGTRILAKKMIKPIKYEPCWKK